jgi:hypothetical protein
MVAGHFGLCLNFKRRRKLKKFILSSLAALFMLVPMTAMAEAGKIPYSPQAVDSALAKGCSVFLEFGASW